MFTLFSGRHIGGLSRSTSGGFIPGTIILRGTFRRISQLWDNTHTLHLENCLVYLLSIISQFLGFIHRMVFDFICYCMTMNTLHKGLSPTMTYYMEFVSLPVLLYKKTARRHGICRLCHKNRFYNLQVI